MYSFFFRWDWDILSEMLEHSFQHPDRLNDCLQTKWVRRLSGFYRCASEEKGIIK
jgi:rapamycin-insensitive companion of mTOR